MLPPTPFVDLSGRSPGWRLYFTQNLTYPQGLPETCYHNSVSMVPSDDQIADQADFYRHLGVLGLTSRALTVFYYDEATKKAIKTELQRRGQTLASCVPTGVRPRLATSAHCHAWVLLKVQQVRRVRRKLQRNYPWSADIISLLGFISLFDVVPTVSAILFAPEHLLWKTPKIVGQGSPVYVRPIRFLALCGAWAAAITALFRLNGYGQWKVLIWLAAISFAAPVWIPSFILLAAVVARTLNKTDDPGLFQGIFRSDTYKHIWNPILVWDLMYFGLSLFVSAGAILAAIFVPLLGVHQLIGDIDPRFTFLFGGGLLVFGAHFFVFRPYMALLTAASSRPSPTMLDWLARDFGSVLANIDRTTAGTTASAWISGDTAVADILSEWGRLRRAFKYQEEHAASRGAKELVGLLQDRTKMFGSAMRPLGSLLAPFAGCPSIDRLLAETERVASGVSISGS